MIKQCKGCSKEKDITNSHFQLCLICNNARLKTNKGDIKPKVYKYIPKVKEPLRSKERPLKIKSKKSLFVNLLPEKKTTKEKIGDDEIFYEKCFNQSNHICEECSLPLPDYFRDINGKVAARWRYSHIIPKSIASELRHSIDNINHLCLECHGEWENGNKAGMGIFAGNYKKFPNYLNKVIPN
jgi:hypothetical protein